LLKTFKGLGMVDHTWEAKIGRTAVQDQPGQKVRKTAITTNKLDMLSHACHLSYYAGGMNGRIAVQADLRKKT
jgi:hypothetical protein